MNYLPLACDCELVCSDVVPVPSVVDQQSCAVCLLSQAQLVKNQMKGMSEEERKVYYCEQHDKRDIEMKGTKRHFNEAQGIVEDYVGPSSFRPGYSVRESQVRLFLFSCSRHLCSVFLFKQHSPTHTQPHHTPLHFFPHYSHSLAPNFTAPHSTQLHFIASSSARWLYSFVLHPSPFCSTLFNSQFIKSLFTSQPEFGRESLIRVRCIMKDPSLVISRRLG